ncbi:hypothetical protein KM043_018078 [Ampulex compressa]|nr:hypothetical protein KM043_018078 [Ampulex compressa]
MEVSKLREFMEMVGTLKHLKRKGWLLKNVQDAETVAAHMYRMAILSMVMDIDEKLDKFKVLQMALVHDLAECIVGDITPHCGVSPEVKHRLEDEAMEEICKLLGNKGSAILEIFREYEERITPEALFVKDLDTLDLMMQASEYEKRDKAPGSLEEFFTNTNQKFKFSCVSKLASEILSDRNAHCHPSQNAE